MKEKNMKWSEIIEQNTERLKEALQKAFCDALDYRSMEFSVEIYQDGKSAQMSKLPDQIFNLTIPGGEIL